MRRRELRRREESAYAAWMAMMIVVAGQTHASV
jgi:hypothetical protein